MSDSNVSVQPSADALLANVVAEITDRLHAGDAVDVEAYAARHPALAERLRHVLPALEGVENVAVSPCTAGRAPGDGEAVAGLLGDFRIVREIGRGGMAVVYEAEQMSLERQVALKVLPLASTMDARRLQRFHIEAKAAACLHHTNIVPVFAVGSERGVHFYAMQLIDGMTLAAVIHDLRQPGRAAPAASTAPAAYLSTTKPGGDAAYFRKVAELGAQAAEALDYAHQMGVVHRDVKPGNLMLDGRGTLWVTDFGLAQLQADAGLTMTGDLLGTLRYMSPEQALGKRAPIDHRTDVYSLGVTLYELVTLRPAFGGEDRQELLRQVASEEPTPPRRLNRAVPRELETIVLKALEKNPAERYATAQELADDLRRYLDDQPVRAKRPSVLQVSRKWVRRNQPVAWAAAVCLLVSLVAFAGSVGWVLGDRAVRRQEAEVKLLEALAAAEPGLQKGNPWDPGLITAVQRAESQMNGGLLRPHLRQRVEQLHKDVKMLAELERIRLDQTGVRDDTFDWAVSDTQYAQAFGEYGIEVDALGLEEAAVLVRDSAIRTHLVAGLDDWAAARAYQDHEVSRARKLLAFARQVDPDPWRNRLRELVLSRDLADLDELARSAPVEELPAATLGMMGLMGAWRATEPGPLVELLRRAQRRYPADFWINLCLAEVLTKAEPAQLEEAIGFYRASVAVRPQSPASHFQLGRALRAKGDFDGAIAEYREALRLKKDYAEAHHRLGIALDEKGDFDGAIAEHREALRIKGDYAEGHNNIGSALFSKGDMDGAIAEYREALRLKKDYANALLGLGNALNKKGDLDGAIAEYREAVRVKKDYVDAHNSLGNALLTTRNVDGAIAEYREALRLKKDYADAHYNLGVALRVKGDVDGAIDEYRDALQLKKDCAEAHCNLGQVLRDKGQFAEALIHLRRGHELGSKNSRWPYRSTQWVKDCERLVELDAKLPQILKGEVAPVDVGERLALAQLCQLPCKSLNAASARFYAEAFAHDPKLSGADPSNHRYNAACAAALAGCGQGKDADTLDDEARTRLRGQALDWLRADLKAWGKELDKAPNKAGPVVVQQMDHWRGDADFAGVRGPDALSHLPEAERDDWQKLWDEVEALRKNAAAKSASKP